MVQRAPFRMTDNDVTAAHVRQHLGRYFTGKRTRRVGANALSAQLNAAVPNLTLYFLQIHEWRANQDFAVEPGWQLIDQIGDKLLIFMA